MKKILCVNNIVRWYSPGGKINLTSVSHLTINKWYDVIEEDNTLYMICNDNGCDQYYQKNQNNFISQKEYRKLKLNNLKYDI